MMTHHRTVSIWLAAIALGMAACDSEKIEVASAAGRPLIAGLGEYSMPITTRSPLAQKYFDQGLRLVYAFNHPEAVRAFEAAEKVDSGCAMCAWGAALARGPNINALMEAADVAPAVAAVERAQVRAAGTTPREQAYIAALASRYSAAADADRAALDRAYAEQMRALAALYPDDLDAQTLAAEAVMDLTPWDYWTKDGELKPTTAEIVALLEGVLKRDPNHPGANHYYIHAVEASRDPGRALPSAKRLETLATSAGHLVHMSAHTYMRVGQYADASRANERGALADEEYMTWCRSGGSYVMAYYPHNLHFLWASESMEGRSAAAIATARKLAAQLPPEAVRGVPAAQELAPVIYYALVRFGRWDEVLAEVAPPEDLHYSQGMWHYARGMAFAAQGELEPSRAEQASVAAIAGEDAMQKLAFLEGSGAQLLEIASAVLAAEIAEREGKHDLALAELEKAKQVEHALAYVEPPPWYFPVRQVQGSALLSMGKPAQAEVVFREDLVVYPENGWSLFGLAQSLRAQGKPSDAEQSRYEKAWAAADVKLEKPRF